MCTGYPICPVGHLDLVSPYLCHMFPTLNMYCFAIIQFGVFSPPMNI
uniref:Uncharacterized protein n=1 Tax=Arundo donax TaxID=35708 RepID=A0A0A9CUZ0_ARUDO